MADIRITNPASATVWRLGGYYEINWEPIDTVENVNIFLNDTGVLVETIALDTANTGQYFFSVPLNIALSGLYSIQVQTISVGIIANSPAFSIVAAQKITDFTLLKEFDKSVIVELKAGIDLHYAGWTAVPATIAFWRPWTGKEIIEMYTDGLMVTRVFSYADLLAAIIDVYWIDELNQRLYVQLWSSCPAKVIIPNGLLASWTLFTNTAYYWYTFDNIVGASLIDEMAHTNGTIYGAVQSGPPTPNFGYCMYFDGSNDYINLNWGLNNKACFELSFWIIGTLFTGKSIFGHYDGAAQGVALVSSGTQLRLFVTNVSGTTKDAWSPATINVTDGAWHHIIAVYTGSAIAIKVDAVWGTSVAQTGNTKNTSYTDYLGCANWTGTPGDFAKCNIEQFRCFLNVFSGIDEQKRLYEEWEFPSGKPDDWLPELTAVHTNNNYIMKGADNIIFVISAVDTSCPKIYSSKIVLKTSQRYLLQFDYSMNAPAKKARYEINIFSGGTNLFLQADGSFSTVSNSFEIPNATVNTTLYIDFITHASYTDYYIRLRHYAGASASCQITFDTFKYEEVCSPQTTELLGLTWLGFCNGQNNDPFGFIPEGATREIYYEPLLNTSSIPALTQKIDDFYRSAMTISFGDIVFLNNGWFWTNREIYDWHNKIIRAKVGEMNCDYDDYVTIYQGITKKPSFSDQSVTIGVRDQRTGDLLSIPVDRFLIGDYPNIDTKQINKPIPILFGEKTNITPIEIDTATWKYKISQTTFGLVNWPINAINDVYQAGVALATPADYSIDLANGEFTLVADPGSDAITCDAEGLTCSYDFATETYTNLYTTNGADILFFILNILNGISTEKINLTSFLDLQVKRTQGIGIYLKTLTKTIDIIRILQSSIVFHFLPDLNGQYLARYYDRVTPIDTPLFEHGDFQNFAMTEDTDFAYGTVVIQYDQDPSNGTWKEENLTNATTEDIHEIQSTIEIPTYLIFQSEALALVTFFSVLLQAPANKISGVLMPAILDKIPSDKIIVSREIIDGNNLPVTILSNKVYAIMELRKNIANLKTDVVAILDSQAGGNPSHANIAHDDDHGDLVYTDVVPHVDNAHLNIHQDIILHEDYHDNHSDHDYHDYHYDAVHSDHNDGYTDDYYDLYEDHQDKNSHEDYYSDDHWDYWGHTDEAHQDSEYHDAHLDYLDQWYEDIPHSDTHGDGHGDHTDAHSDGPYIDWYEDIPHQDSEI